MSTTSNNRPWPRALAQAGVAAAIAALLLYRGHRVVPAFLGAVVLFVVLSSLLAPKVFFAFEAFGRKLGEWVGIILGWLLLVPMFYLVFFPGRILLGLMRRDPLRCAFPAPDTKSFWIPRKPVKDPAEYQRQY